jgi:hypothetical protein
VIAYPSNSRPTLILIIPGTTGVVTGHSEDKAIVACCRSEVAIACPFIRVRHRVRHASEHRGKPAALVVARRRETGDWATELFVDIGRDHALGGDRGSILKEVCCSPATVAFS